MNASDPYTRYIEPIEDQMIGVIWRVLRDPDESDDALQNALTKIWAKRRAVFEHPNPKALILRICINSAYDMLRRRVRDKHDLQALRERITDLTDRSGTDVLIDEEVREQIMAQIARLPRKQAVAALMRLVDSMPYAEIAQALGCSETTARVHVTRSRTRLRERLGHLGPTNTR
jgi:RNA polymerase sigma-70 factor (ECF subfamily)